jgi:hypothetical protein
MSTNQVLRLGRRHFLTGVGGAALALPFLSSLEKPARAGGGSGRPRYFYLGTDHGGCWDTNYYPSTPTPNTQAIIPGHNVASGALAPSSSGGNTVLSPVLTASASSLTTALVGKMNVLRGLDVPWYIAHNTGLHLGNFARNDGNGGDGTAVTALGMRPTIDQIMAHSSNFYTAADLSSTTLSSMIINPGRALSWWFSDPSQGTASAVQNVQGVSSSLQLFNSIFGAALKGPPTRPPVVDKILANYNSLRQGNSRLSSADKSRLDTHIAMLAQLETSLSAELACAVPAVPTMDAGTIAPTTAATATAWGQLFLDVVALAFNCGASRIGVLGWGDTSAFVTGWSAGGDWHHYVAHQWYLDQQQAWLTQSYQAVFESALVYLAAKLDKLDDGNGQTVLDNSLLVWSQECCMETHASYSMQVSTFGSAGGYFNTGLLCDYRKNGDTASAIVPYNDAGGTSVNASMALAPYTTYTGVLYEQWLATQLLSMGITPSEFELWKDANGNVEHGYGTPYVSTTSWVPQREHYVDTSSPYFQIASEPLPFLAKG